MFFHVELKKMQHFCIVLHTNNSKPNPILTIKAIFRKPVKLNEVWLKKVQIQNQLNI